MAVKLQAILPKRRLSTHQFRQAIEGALNKTLRQVEAEFKKTTRTWNRKVDFYVMSATRRSGALEGFVGTNDEVYRYVTRGTKPHIIRPRRSRLLRFRGGYRSKTVPGRVSSRAGGASGDFRFAKEVHHPGTTARGFEEAIAAKHQKTLQKNIDAAIRKITEK